MACFITCMYIMYGNHNYEFLRNGSSFIYELYTPERVVSRSTRDESYVHA